MTTVVYKDGWKNKEYKVPAISNKTDKGKWLNAYVKKFFTGTHNYNLVGKIHLKLKKENRELKQRNRMLYEHP